MIMSGPKDKILRARSARMIPNGMYGHEATHHLAAALAFFRRWAS